MSPPNVNYWKTDPKYIELLSYLIKRTENVESPMSVRQLVRDFHQKSGEASEGSRFRIFKIRNVIHKIGHIDTNTRVKVLFALSAPVDAVFLKKLRKDALVKVDEKKRITHYKAKDGNLELRGGHSQSEKLSLINNYFKNKNHNDEVPKNKEDKEMRDFIEFINKKCDDVNSPLTLRQLTKDFNKHFGLSRSSFCIQNRIGKYCHEIQKTDFSDTPSKVKQLFGLGAKLGSDYLEKLRKDAVVEVDNLNRITKYTADDGGLTLHGDHSFSAKNSIGQLASKRSHRTLINSYFENKNDADAFPDTEKEKEMGNLIEFITKKCDAADTPLCITQLTEDFNNNFGTSRSLLCVWKRVKAYCYEVQKTKFLDTHSKVKQLFCLGATLGSDFLKELRKDASVEVDNSNRITKYTANNGRLALYGDHSRSAKNKSGWIVRRKNKKRVKKHCNSDGDEDEESEKEEESEEDSDEYSSEEFDSEFDSVDENDALDETTDLMEPSNKADEFDNETPVRNYSEISIDDNFDFDPPTERSNVSDEIEIREDDEKDDVEITENTAFKTQRSETLPEGKTSSSTSHTLKAPKRKADKSAGSTSSKRTKPSSDNKSMNPEGMNGNSSHDEPPRIELNPFDGSPGLPKETQKDSDIQQIPKPRPKVMESPIKEEYEKKTQTSLKTVLNAYKSLILGLDTSGLSKLQMDLDKLMLEAGRRSDVSTKEVVMAMDFLIVKLAKHGAPKPSEDSISLRDILLMLRTIILNSSFNGLEVILEMLKKNIEQLKVLDKKIPVSKVDSVLRATFDIICT